MSQPDTTIEVEDMFTDGTCGHCDTTHNKGNYCFNCGYDVPNTVISKQALESYINNKVKEARIDELERLKKIDAFNEAYSTDPRPSRLVSIRLDELKSTTKELEK